MEQAVANLLEGYELFNRGEYDASAEHLHPDVSFARVSEVETTLEGKDAVRGNMEPDVWERQEVEIHGTEVIGEAVIVDTTFHAAGRSSGIELHQAGYHLWQIRDGKGSSFRFFTDRDEAVAAARGD